jgi:hypothetical protein
MLQLLKGSRDQNQLTLSPLPQVGPRGVGKSAMLLHTIAWARENGWITLVLPRVNNLVSRRGTFESGCAEQDEMYGIMVQPNEETGLYGQVRKSTGILKHLLICTDQVTFLLSIPHRKSTKHMVSHHIISEGVYIRFFLGVPLKTNKNQKKR